MRPTRFGLQGVAFYGAMVAAFYAAPYSNLFFLLLGFLTMLGLTGVFGAWRNLAGVRASCGEDVFVAAGEAVTARVRVEAGRRTRFQLGLRLAAAEDEEPLRGRLALLAGSAEAELRGAALPRGVYPLSGGTVETSFPFGLVRRRRPIEGASDIIVYPAPLGARAERGAGTGDDELAMQLDQPGDLQPAGLRDHREGEGLRGVHWRASARRNKLVVQEWEGASGDGFEVCLDRRCAPEELERALGWISGLVHRARADKETLRLHTQGESATFGAGHLPWEDALRLLAAARPLPAAAEAPPAVSPSVLRLPAALKEAA